MLTTTDRIERCIARHPEWDNARVCKSIPGGRLAEVVAVREGRKGPPPPPKPKTVETLLASFDLAGEIRRQAASIPRREYREDEELRRACGAAGFQVGQARWRATSTRAEFERFKAVLPDKRVVWCCEHTAAELRRRLEDIQ